MTKKTMKINNGSTPDTGVFWWGKAMVAYGAHISGVEGSSPSPASLRKSLTSES